MYDILIRNGTLLDGSGKQRYVADVAVKDGKIVAVGKDLPADAKEVIDASGRYVTPGFIDTHSHADKIVLFHNTSYNVLEQGITFQLMGQCGESAAPYSAGQMMALENSLSKEDFDRVKELTATPARFLEEAEKQTFGINMGFLLGHQALRAYVMGYTDTPPTEEQFQAMEKVVSDAMEAGYWGMSTGLVYIPSVYADTAELIRLSRIVAKHGGIYASHVRGEGDVVESSVREAITIGHESGAQVLISHLKVMGEHNKGKSVKLLEMIDAANGAGDNVSADQYPFEAGSAPLISQIPPKFLVGGNALALEKLKDPEMRRQMEYSIFNESAEFESNIYFAGYEGSLIAEAPYTPEHIGKTLTQLAQEQGKAPFDAYADLLIANKGDAQGIYLTQNMEDICRIMTHPRVFAGCDWAELPVIHQPEERGGGHPRCVATMVKRLQTIREYGLCSAEEAICSITGRPAQVLGIENRGLLKEGYAADICVIDYPNLRCHADYDHPFARNEGIDYVIVNGEIAVANGRITGKRAGRMQRHKSQKK